MKPRSSLFFLSAVTLVSGTLVHAQISMPESSLPTGSPKSAKTANVSDVIASAGGENFKLDDIRPYLAKLDDKQKALLAQDPATLNKFVRTFMVQRLLLKEAQTAKWAEQPASVAQLRRIQENAIADGYLESVSTFPGDYPSDAEVQAAYDANKEAFLSPRQLRLAQILIEAPKDSTKKAQDMATARVEMVKKDLADPETDFVKVAQTRASETGNAIRGGEVGLVPESQLPADLRDVVLKLPAGGISEPLSVKGGWVIIKVLEIKEPATLPLTAVREAVVQRLRQIKMRQAGEAYIKQLVEKIPITINETALPRLLPPVDQ